MITLIGMKHNFSKRRKSTINSHGVRYDYRRVVHYRLRLSPRTDGQQFELSEEGYVTIGTFLHSMYEIFNVH